MDKVAGIVDAVADEVVPGAADRRNAKHERINPVGSPKRRSRRPRPKVKADRVRDARRSDVVASVAPARRVVT